MTPAVTRAIRMLSSLHGQSPTQKAYTVASMTVFSKKHFPKFLGFVCFTGFVSGFCFQESLRLKEVCFMKYGIVELRSVGCGCWLTPFAFRRFSNVLLSCVCDAGGERNQKRLCSEAIYCSSQELSTTGSLHHSRKQLDKSRSSSSMRRRNSWRETPMRTIPCT